MTQKDKPEFQGIDRRNYITVVAAGLTAGLAGCSGDGDGPSNGDGNDNGDGTSDGDGNGNKDGDDTTDGDGQPSVDELTFLTWNIGWLESSVTSWIEEFKSSGYQDTEVTWTDKPGADLPTYYQTQLQTGDAPEVVDTQSSVYSRYANDDVFTPMDEFASEELLDKFGERSLDFSKLDDNLYRLPFYQQTNATYYRKKWFDEAGIDPPTVSEPYTTAEYFDAATSVVDNSDAEFGLTLHRFDYMFWPFFWSEGVDVLDDDSNPAFNTSRAAEIVGRLRDLTDDGVIPELTWTQRYTPQNEQFGAGNTGMFMTHAAPLRAVQNYGSDWVTSDTLGIAHAPRNVGYYSAHGLSITQPNVSDTEKQAAFDLIEVVLSADAQEDLLRNSTVMAGNLEPQRELANDDEFASNNPLLVELYDLWSEVKSEVIVPPQIPASGEIQSILDSEVAAAALGEKSPEQALSDAESDVNDAIED